MTLFFYLICNFGLFCEAIFVIQCAYYPPPQKKPTNLDFNAQMNITSIYYFFWDYAHQADTVFAVKFSDLSRAFLASSVCCIFEPTYVNKNQKVSPASVPQMFFCYSDICAELSVTQTIACRSPVGKDS